MREKAGHTGTLDPLASGLLPLCFGEATKFAQFLLDAAKRYTATVRFGVTTTTGDAEGEVIETHPVSLTRERIEAALPAFTGRISQVPPAYSALKFEGRSHYEYARAGIACRARAARRRHPGTVARVVEFAGCRPRRRLQQGNVHPRPRGRPGRALGCGAHLAGLRRTATGGFDIGNAIALEQLESLSETARDAALLPAAALLRDLPALRLAAGDAARFRQGAAVPAPGFGDGACAVFAGIDLLGVADVGNALAQPRRVVATSTLPSEGHG